MRYAAVIEYDGYNYHGWQRQNNVENTIQNHVELSLSKIANHKIDVHCCGRTDAGVHGLYQVVHFDTDAKRDIYDWIAGSNTLLPKNIRVKKLQKVRDDFHARYDATFRHYFYLIQNSSQPSAIFCRHNLWHRQALDIEKMQTAASCLHGEHDFSAFRAAECQAKTAFRFIKFIRFYDNHPWLTVHICGNAFLHHMVRNIIGSLLPIGDGRKKVSWLSEVLASKDRRQAGITAPAQGLYFAGVEYPPADQLSHIDFSGFPVVSER